MDGSTSVWVLALLGRIGGSVEDSSSGIGRRDINRVFSFSVLGSGCIVAGILKVLLISFLSLLNVT